MRLVAFAALSLAVIGCSDPYAGRYELSGKVTLPSGPIKDGIILFDPLDNQDTKGVSQILNGTYKIPRENGLKVGKYLVRITAGDGKTPANQEAGAPGGSTNIVSKDLVPEAWNTKSTEKIEIKATGPNTFDFNITN